MVSMEEISGFLQKGRAKNVKLLVEDKVKSVPEDASPAQEEGLASEADLPDEEQE